MLCFFTRVLTRHARAGASGRAHGAPSPPPPPPPRGGRGSERGRGRGATPSGGGAGAGGAGGAGSGDGGAGGPSGGGDPDDGDDDDDGDDPDDEDYDVFADAADEDEDDADDPYAGGCSNEDEGPSQRVPQGLASWFCPAAERRALNSRTRVYGYVLPTAPSHARGLHYPRPLLRQPPKAAQVSRSYRGLPG